MGNLFYPQLESGAVSQYPIKKTNLVRTVKNVLPDGSMILYRDPNGSHRVWQLAYTDLNSADVEALQVHFASTAGPFRAFTFIDPTENMLVWSSDLTSPPWQCPSLITLQAGLNDPDGGTGGFAATNAGQATVEIIQTLTVPSGYQYCLSLYATSPQPSQLVLTRRGQSSEESTTCPVGPTWSRLVSSGSLDDEGSQFTVAIALAAGQQVGLYGVQLEPQVYPSRYRSTASVGGVFSNSHWGVDQLTIQA